MSNRKIAAIIIAAGYSSRMGAFKPLLPLGDFLVIDHSICLFKSIGINTLVVVTGHHSEKLENHLKQKQVTCAYNPNFDQGMFSSIVRGIRELPTDIEAFFMLPVDVPVVAPLTLEKLLHKFRSSPCKIVYPSHLWKKGHPPLISSKLSHTIENHTGDGGLKQILKQFESEASYVEVDDPGILLDMDTPEGYERMKAYYKRTFLNT